MAKQVNAVSEERQLLRQWLEVPSVLAQASVIPKLPRPSGHTSSYQTQPATLLFLAQHLSRHTQDVAGAPHLPRLSSE